MKDLAVDKVLAHNKDLRDYGELNWVLLYPDFDFVLNIPGTQEPFSVEKYKKSIGRPYSRTHLYLCKMQDYLRKQNGRNK